METFEPSNDFVGRVMTHVREYECEKCREKERLNAFIFSKPVVMTLSAAGLVLGIINTLRMALILLTPSLCL
jgi:hypothetical protein